MPAAAFGKALDRPAEAVFHPIFVTKVRRQTRRLELAGSVIEVAFDEGSIEAGEHREPVTEIGLELKSGDPRALYDLGIDMLDTAPLRVGTRSKADRGYCLALGLTPKPSKAKPPAITAEHTLDEVVGVLLATCQHQILTNQPIAECGHNPEGIHQMRVALRRLRTVCTLLRRELGSPTAKFFGAEAKWLAQQLSAARNWDVFVTEILSELTNALQSDTLDFDALRQAAERHRLTPYAAARETLTDQRYNRFQLLLRSWIERRGWRNALTDGSLAPLLEPTVEFADRATTRLRRKALESGAHFRNLDTAARHRLRIALKKLRYTIELFQELYNGGNGAKDYLASLSALQDVLGRDHDSATTEPLLLTLSLNATTPAVHRSIGVVMGWQAHDRIAVRPTLHKQWKQFKAMPPFWLSK
jgi:inorganic triphosphatase YgiF